MIQKLFKHDEKPVEMTKQWQKNDKTQGFSKFLMILDFVIFCHLSVMFLSFSLCFAWFSLNIPNFARHKQNDKKMTKK